MAINRIPPNGLEQGNKLNLDKNSNGTSPNITPPLSFLNDNGTGLFSPIPGVIAVASQGVEILRFTLNGITTNNGGIYGSSNPDYTKSNITLYVNKGDLNADDSLLSTGGSINTPFYSIERALLEVAKRSFVSGVDNDKNDGYTIIVYPGDYLVDNRPGVKGVGDITNTTTEFYKFNPANSGGVVVPRGTSIIAIDASKTTIRPKYVPNPTIVVPGVMWDGATMIERNYGYIAEQTYLKLKQDYPAITNINIKCRRDIGLLISSVVDDLRGGGNVNSYVAGEMYVLGNSNNYISNAEIPATISALQLIKQLCSYTVTNTWTAYIEITAGKTINRYVPIVSIDYQSNGDCSSVVSAITSLSDLIIGIISNPSSYSISYNKTLSIYESTPIFKITSGCYIANLKFKDALDIPYNGVVYTGDIPSFLTAINTFYSHHRLVGIGTITQKNKFGELADYYKKIDAWDTIIDGGVPREILFYEYTSNNIYNVVDVVGNNSYLNQNPVSPPYVVGCSVESLFGLCGVLIDGKNTNIDKIVVEQFTAISLQFDQSAFVSDLTDTIDNTKYRDIYEHYGFKSTNDVNLTLNRCEAVGQADGYITTNGGSISSKSSSSKFGGISLSASGNSKFSLPIDRNHNILKIIPPDKINPNNYQEILIGYLDTTNITNSSITITNYNGVTLPINSYIYVNIVNPLDSSIQVKLQAKVVSVGVNSINVVAGTSISDQNAIYAYINTLQQIGVVDNNGNYGYQSSWYDVAGGTFIAQMNAEIARRKLMLNNAPIYVQRIVDTRTTEQKNYSILVATPPNQQKPVDGYIISQDIVNNIINKYYVADVETVDATMLTNNYISQGQISKLKILRANNISTGNSYPDILNDLEYEISTTLDPRLYIDTTSISANYTGASYLSIYQFLLDFGYTVANIATMLLPNNASTLLNKVNSIITKLNTNTVATGAGINFNLVKPSTITAFDHSWYYVGYKNYSAPFVSGILPSVSLTLVKKLEFTQSSTNGGVIYSDGVDEVGNIYKGGNIYQPITEYQNIRYDGESITPNKTIDYDPIMNFGVNSAFKLKLGDVIFNLTDANIPIGLKSTAFNYGLSRASTTDEVTNYKNAGYIRPSDLKLLGLDSGSTGNVKTTGAQTIAGVKTFSASPKVPNGVTGLDAINFNQLLSLIDINGNKIILPEGLVITWGSVPTPVGGMSGGGDTIAYYGHTYTNLPYVYANCSQSSAYSHVNVRNTDNDYCQLSGWTSFSDAISIPAQVWNWFAIGK